MNEDAAFEAEMAIAMAASLRDTCNASPGHSSDDGEFSSGEDGVAEDSADSHSASGGGLDDGDDDIAPDPRTIRATNAPRFASYDRRGLVARQRELLTGLQETTGLGREAARALASAFKWHCADAMAEFVADPEGVCKRIGIDADATRGVGLAGEDDAQSCSGSCAICFEDVDLLGLSCGHVYCRTCWSEHVCEQVQSRSALVIRCPRQSCMRVLESSTAASLLSGPLRKRFIDQLIAVFVEQNRAVVYCPHAGCELAVELLDSPGGNNEGVHCSAGHAFCFRCKQRPHAPAPCRISEFIERRTNSPNAVESMINEATKPCPNCKVRIIKNGGCNHVTCASCGYHMCWACGLKYGDGPKGSAMWGHQCPIQPTDLSRGLKDVSDEAFRFNWFSERFAVIEDAMKETEKFLEKESRKYARRIGNDCVARAAAALISARRVLADSFVFSFYRPQQAKRHTRAHVPKTFIERDLFEFAQSELSDKVSMLSKIVEDRSRMPKIDATVVDEYAAKEMMNAYYDERGAELREQQMRILSLIRTVEDCRAALIAAAIEVN